MSTIQLYKSILGILQPQFKPIGHRDNTLRDTGHNSTPIGIYPGSYSKYLLVEYNANF